MNTTNFFKALSLIGGRYFLFAALAFLAFYIVFRKKLFYRKIQQRFPKNSDYARELLYSFLTISIFSFVSLILFWYPPVSSHTTRYTNITQYGWTYYFLAYPLMFLMHDTYFYFTHRLMHHKRLFRSFHLVHHKSVNPSPWAAYAFHPLEALVEVGIVVLFVFTIPVHRSHLVIFFLVMIMYNVYGHLGYELYPKGFHKSRIGRWINTSVNHNQHHQLFKGNYGLYFLFWDRMLGTVRADYDQAFEKVKARQKNVEPEVVTEPGTYSHPAEIQVAAVGAEIQELPVRLLQRDA